MNKNPISYAIQEASINNALVYYDFKKESVTGSVLDNFRIRGRIANLLGNSYHGIVFNATGSFFSSKSNVENFFTTSSGGNFGYSNVVINNTGNIDLKKSSCVLQFEFNGDVKNGILFGCLGSGVAQELGQQYIDYYGFNFGITDRGHLFFQSSNQDGISTHVASDIELSKKNIVSFSLDGNSLDIFRYDILNDNVYRQSFELDINDSLLKQKKMFLGGSDLFFNSSSGQQRTFSGYIDRFLFSTESINENQFKILSSGCLGDYFYISGQKSEVDVVTGSIMTPLYGTGITGSYLQQTGTRIVPTGFRINEVIETGIIFSETQEGFSVMRNAGGYLEEVGFLDPSFFGIYNPQDESAEGTLGLMSNSFSQTGYKITETEEILFGTEPLYGEFYLYGTTSEVTGYHIQTLSGKIETEIPPSSGLIITGLAEKYKKNNIYVYW